MIEAPSAIQEECPGCRGRLTNIMGVWICQTPCGFESRASNPLARLFLYQAIASLRQVMKSTRQIDTAIPGNCIIEDFRRALESEEV